MELLIVILFAALAIAGFTLAALWVRRRTAGPRDLRRAGQYDDVDPNAAAGRAMDKTAWNRTGGGL